MNPFEKLHQRDALMSRFKPKLLEGVQITKDDLHKFFVVNPEKTAGRLMSREELCALPINEIGEWYEVGMFDVTAW